MTDLKKQLSNVLNAFNGRARKLTTEEKVQAFYAHSMDNDESELEKLLKSGVSLEDVKKKIHQVILDSVKEDKEEQFDWKAQAKELFAMLKSDQAEQIKQQIKQSGGAVQDILDGVLQRALDESQHRNSRQYCLDYMVPAIELGANPNLKDIYYSWTAMMVAAMYVEKPDAIIQMMLDKGADPNCQNEDGWTAMMFVARYVEQPDAVIQMMLDKGADPNLQNKNGWTAMMFAIRYVKQPDSVIQRMLDKGADPTILHSFFGNVVDHAKYNEDNKNKKRTVRLLKKAIRKYKRQERRKKAKAFLSFNR